MEPQEIAIGQLLQSKICLQSAYHRHLVCSDGASFEKLCRSGFDPIENKACLDRLVWMAWWVIWAWWRTWIWNLNSYYSFPTTDSFRLLGYFGKRCVFNLVEGDNKTKSWSWLPVYYTWNTLNRQSAFVYCWKHHCLPSPVQVYRNEFMVSMC